MENEQHNEVTPIHSERSHSLLGGSSAYIWENCPGAVFLWKDLPTEPPSHHALEGTAAHEVAEIDLTDWLQYRLEGTDPEIRLKFLTEADDDMVKAAREYRETIWEKLLECNITGKTWGIEETLTFDERYGSFGTVDFWAIYVDARAKRTGILCDFKYGYYPVDAEDNPQLAFYAIALQNEVRARGKDLDQVRAAIFQPRRADGKKFQEFLFTASGLEKWRKKFYRAMEQVYVKRKPKFKVGEYCRFCKAQGVCPSYNKQITTEQAVVFNPPDVATLPDVEKVSDAQLLAIWESEAKIQSFLKAVKSHIMQRAQLGNDVPGIKVVEGRTRRMWINDLNTIKGTLEGLGLQGVTTEKMLSLTKVQAALTKQYGRNEAKSLIEPLVTHSRPSLSIVPESDPRPKISNLISVFDVIEEEDE